MILYLKPRTKILSMIMASVILLILGARLGARLVAGDMETHAQIKPISSMETNQPHVGLVVDAQNPKPEDVTALLDLMEKAEVKATWFFSATILESMKDALKEIPVKGHEFGLKGTEEKPMDRLAEIEAKDRLKRARETFSKMGEEPCPFFYAPLGKISDTLLKAAFEEGLTVVRGSVDGKLVKGKPQDIEKKAQGIRPGDIVVIYATNKGITPDAASFETFAKSLRSHGLSLVTLSVLAKGVR